MTRRRRAPRPPTGLGRRPRPGAMPRTVAGRPGARPRWSRLLGHRLVPAVGVLTWAIGLGVRRRQHRGPAPRAGPRSSAWSPRSCCGSASCCSASRCPSRSIAALGLPLIAVVAVSLVGTLVFTTWLGQPDGAEPGPEPAHRHRHRHLRRLGHRGDGGHRRRRRGGRHRRDRDGDAVRDHGPGRCCRCCRAPRAQRPAVRRLGRGQRPRGRPGGRRGQPGRGRRARHRGRRQAHPGRDARARRGRRQRHPAGRVARRRHRGRRGHRSCRCSCSASSPASRCAAPA